MAELSAEQIQYAIRDAWVSLQIYNQLSKIKIPGPLSEPALPGTQVILRHSDGQSIAHGWISHQIGGSSHKGVNITKTRVLLTVSEVLVPAAIIPLHNQALQSFGDPLFDIVVKCNHLRTFHPTHPPPLPPSSQPSSSLSPIHHLATSQASTGSLLANVEPLSVDEADLEEFHASENWMHVADEPINNGDTEKDLEVAEVDLTSFQCGIDAMPLPPKEWPILKRSGVLWDPWHTMARIKVPVAHGFRRPFARALCDAMFIPDQEDKQRVSSYLLTIGSSWEEVLRFKPSWLWKHCKRIIPPPEQLYPAVYEVYMTFGPLKDSSTGLPLFNSKAWKSAHSILKGIQAGLLSDPPGIVLYFQVGLDVKHGGLPIYRCARGTNNTEGGVHHSGRRQLPIAGASPCHASACLLDFVLKHNLLVSPCCTIMI